MVSLKRRRVSWRGYLFLAVSVAVVVVTPWHRARWSDFLVYVLAAVLVCGPLFAWLLLAHERRAATVVSVVQLAVLAGLYSASQWLLSGPVRPPVADWALFTALATGMICLLGAVHQRRHLRWPRLAGACTLVLASWLTAGATFAVAVGDGAQPSAKVEPYLSEIDPGWGYRVTEPQFDGGSGGVYFLTATVTGKDELYLRDLGWNAECEPVGGLLARLKMMDWGAHCLTIIGSTVQVEVRTGHLPGPPLSILCCRQEVLRPAPVLTHMAATPARVRSWASALEWLPEVAAEATADDVLAELDRRAATVSARMGYLLQGLRPDIAGRIVGPKTKTWFGLRGKIVRHDSRWQVADTLLPFDPRVLEPVP